MIFGKSYVTKEFTFDAMHQLPNHDGLCKNHHGHTYKLQVTVTGLIDTNEGKASEGMIYDFGHLKKLVKELVLNKMDHAFLAKGDEEILPEIKRLGTRVCVMGVRTTAENMSKYIFELLSPQLPKNVYLKNVRLYETPTSWADYTLSDPTK
jgi:6-pyruvoyltetrahydropterin/6-carboxytetrahydropterin synthase